MTATSETSEVPQLPALTTQETVELVGILKKRKVLLIFKEWEPTDEEASNLVKEIDKFLKKQFSSKVRLVDLDRLT